MRAHNYAPANVRDSLAEQVSTLGLRGTSRATGVHHATIAKVLAGKPVSPAAVQMLARVAPKVRTAKEFLDGRQLAIQPPTRSNGAFSWDLETIKGARDDQMTGNFKRPTMLAKALRTDDAMFASYRNRIAPLSAIAAKFVPAGGARGKATAAKAQGAIHIARPTLAGIGGTLANHGVAIGFNEQITNDAGTVVEFRLTEWPLEFVKYNASKCILETPCRDGVGPVEIRHGDGRWTIFSKFDELPWTQEACILPAALVWAAHAGGLSDWNSASLAHGLAKIMGELPEGVSLSDESGALSPEARMFLEMLRDMVSGAAAAGIRPAGSKTDFLANGSTAWQVFAELVGDRTKSAARIYNGTDAMLGSVGGAPGVDISALFNIASSIVQGDMLAIEAGINTGVIQPWCAINEGSSRYAPSLAYQMPDPDAAAKRGEKAADFTRLFETLDQMRAQKFMVDQPVVDRVAADLGISPAPVLAPADKQTSTLVLAPPDIAKVVRVREARASQGLPPFNDARDEMTISELDAQATAAGDKAGAAAPVVPA